MSTEQEEIERDAIRYHELAKWMCKGQPSKDRMAREMLGLVERRKTWPIPRHVFDEAIDRAIGEA